MKIGNEEIFPNKIICLGRNYMDHIEESGNVVPKEPVLFVKTSNCLIGNEEPIIYPKVLFNKRAINRVDHEVELAFIMKKKGKHIPKSKAYDFIKGYTVFNDITARKLQLKSIRTANPWYLSKSLDTFAPIGPRIATTEEIPDPHDLNISLEVNNELRQSSNTKHLLFKIPDLIEYISQYITLEPDDIIATGTPAGIGPINPGDQIKATIEKIGTLQNKVILEE